jgi:hypothetical protein
LRNLFLLQPTIPTNCIRMMCRLTCIICWKELTWQEIFISIPTPLSNKNQFMYGVCLSCLNSNQTHDTKCVACKQSWHKQGASSLQIGTLYKYDIIAAFPCCESRLTCNNCSKPIVDVEGAKLKNFSSFSQEIMCPHCHVVDTHFLKPLQKVFTKAQCENSLECLRGLARE